MFVTGIFILAAGGWNVFVLGHTETIRVFFQIFWLQKQVHILMANFGMLNWTAKVGLDDLSQRQNEQDARGHVTCNMSVNLMIGTQILLSDI